MCNEQNDMVERLTKIAEDVNEILAKGKQRKAAFDALLTSQYTPQKLAKVLPFVPKKTK